MKFTLYNPIEPVHILCWFSELKIWQTACFTLCKDSKILDLGYTSFPFIDSCGSYATRRPTTTVHVQEQPTLAFIVASYGAVSPKYVRREARSRSQGLQEGTSGCSPGITQAISSPRQSTSASDRLKGVPPSCSQSSLLCSGTQLVFSSHGAPPPKFSSLLGMVWGTSYSLLVQFPCHNCRLNSIDPRCITEVVIKEQLLI